MAMILLPVPRDEPHPETLADVIREARHARQMSYRDVERESGGAVGSSTVHKIEQGTRVSVEPRTLTGLARALRVPIDRLRVANGQTARVPREPFTLPDRANALTARQRRLVIAVIDGLLEAHRQ